MLCIDLAEKYLKGFSEVEGVAVSVDGARVFFGEVRETCPAKMTPP